jgi:hypothetical protein
MDKTKTTKSKLISLTYKDLLNISSYFHIDLHDAVCKFETSQKLQKGGGLFGNWFGCIGVTKKKQNQVKISEQNQVTISEQKQVEIPEEEKVEIHLDVLAKILSLNADTQAKGMLVSKELSKRIGYERESIYFIKAFVTSIWDIMMNEKDALHNEERHHITNKIIIKFYKMYRDVPFCYFELTIDTRSSPRTQIQTISCLFHNHQNGILHLDGDERESALNEVQGLMPKTGTRIRNYCNYNGVININLNEINRFTDFLLSIDTPQTFYKTLSEDIHSNNFSVTNDYVCTSDLCQAKLDLLKERLIIQQQNAISLFLERVNNYTVKEKGFQPKSARNENENLKVTGVGLHSKRDTAKPI